ncbi:MAG: RecX family transcriptional regulator [Gloeobacteraceae cyanobacterium ES-bin-316]|nr:RecX family transcriptional regulator [Ferruginibacter sp.]
MISKNIGTEKAWQKIKHFCAYQERSHSETRDKLYSFGLYKNEVEDLLGQLIEENYLNEERFACQFAGGKFRIKKWGRVKIKYELQQKKVSAWCIKNALAQIDESDYEQCLQKLADAKLATLQSENNLYSKKSKLYSYLLQKGFESSLINEVVKELKDL